MSTHVRSSIYSKNLATKCHPINTQSARDIAARLFQEGKEMK